MMTTDNGVFRPGEFLVSRAGGLGAVVVRTEVPTVKGRHMMVYLQLFAKLLDGKWVLMEQFPQSTKTTKETNQEFVRAPIKEWNDLQLLLCSAKGMQKTEVSPGEQFVRDNAIELLKALLETPEGVEVRNRVLEKAIAAGFIQFVPSVRLS